MSYTVRFRMKPHDRVRLAAIEEEVLRYVFGPFQVVGLLAITGYGKQDEYTAKIWPEWDKDYLTTVPLDVIEWSYTRQDDPRERVEVVYGIGDMYPTYITAEDRRRYRALEGLRAYRARLINCVTDHAYYDEYDREYVSCGHGPEEHGPDGCNATVDWYEGTRIYCGCEHYTKPAPLMRIV